MYTHLDHLKQSKHKTGGYIALGLVLPVLFSTLLIIGDVGQWTLSSAEHVSRYEDIRESQTLIYSCVTIIHIRLLTSADTFPQQIGVRIRSGMCEIELIQSTANAVRLSIRAVGRDVQVRAHVTLSVSTGAIIDFVVL